MIDRSDTGWRLEPGLRTLALILGSALLVVGACLLLGLARGFSLNEISRDPLATAGLHPLTGAQSEVGVLIWWSAASISLATWAVLRQTGATRSLVRFFLWSAFITAMLALDDQFQFHDKLAQEWFGLRERYVIVVYGVVLGAYLIAFRSIIRHTEVLLIVLAVVFAGLSVAGDFVSQQFVEAGQPAGPGEVLNYAEDTLKLLAIVSWSAYLIRFSLASLRSLRGRDTGRPEPT
jgi:hypothetical protein